MVSVEKPFSPDLFSFSVWKKALYFLIVLGILFIISLPLLGDYGEILFPLGRDIIFRIAVELIFVLFLLLMILDSSFLPKPSPLMFLLFLFLLVCGLATVFSVQPQFSFWGNSFRGQGFFSQIHYFLFFVILAGVAKKKALWQKMLWLVVVIGGIVGFIGFLEYSIVFSETKSTLNNPNFLGAYLLFPIFITLSLIVSKNNLKLKTLAAASLLFQVLALYFTQSRGAYLGLVVGSVVFFTILLIKKLKLPKKRLLAVFAGLLLLLTVVSVYSFSRLFPPIKDFWQDPQKPRTQSIFLDWSRWEYFFSAVKAIGEKPFFGFGPENFTVAFDKYYRGTIDSGNWFQTWADKVHNAFLETGVAAGLSGLLVYLAIWFVVFRLLAKNFLQQENPPLSSNGSWQMVKIGLLAAFCAYLSNNFFGIDTTTSLIYAYFYFGFVNFLDQSRPEKEAETLAVGQLPPKRKAVFLAVLTLGFWVLFVLIPECNLKALAANRFLNQAEACFGAGDSACGFEKYEQALKINQHSISPYIRYIYGLKVISLSEQQPYYGLKRNQGLIKRAIELQEENGLKEWPYFTRNWVLSGALTNFLLEENPNNQAVLKQKADSYFQKALILSPNRATTWLEWAKTDIIVKDYTKAEEKIAKAEAINKDIGSVWWLRGIIALKENTDYQKADTCFSRAKELGYNFAFDSDLIGDLADTYEQLGNWQKLIEIRKDIIKKSYNDPRGHIKLAEAYLNNNEPEKSKRILEKISLTAPIYYQPEISRLLEKVEKLLPQ